MKLNKLRELFGGLGIDGILVTSSVSCGTSPDLPDLQDWRSSPATKRSLLQISAIQNRRKIKSKALTLFSMSAESFKRPPK
jgi:hypothetical protein